MIKIFHVVLDDEDVENAQVLSRDAGMYLEEWIQFTVDHGIENKLIPEK